MDLKMDGRPLMIRPSDNILGAYAGYLTALTDT